MIIKSIPTGPVQANTHIVIDEVSGKTALIDVGECNFLLLQLLDDDKIKSVEYIRLTHGHFDHIDGVGELKKQFPDAKIAISEEDAPMLSDASLSLASLFGLPQKSKIAPDIILHDGDELDFGSETIKVIHTPGHTKGGVTYQIGSDLFTGDTLFFGSVGRTDFPGGSFDVLNNSVCRLCTEPSPSLSNQLYWCQADKTLVRTCLS